MWLFDKWGSFGGLCCWLYCKLIVCVDVLIMLVCDNVDLCCCYFGCDVEFVYYGLNM